MGKRRNAAIKSLHEDQSHRLKISYLYPFNLGAELELSLTGSHYRKQALRIANAGEAIFQGEPLGQAELVGYLYPFGIGMLELSFELHGELERASELGIHAEKVHIEHRSLPVFFESQIEALASHARPYARRAIPEKPELGREIFCLFSLSPWHADLDVETFLQKHKKTLFGIVTGESSYARLSDYALERESLRNIGYYEEEIILVNRFGAFLHSKEEEILRELTSLALAQYFHVRAANAFLEKSMFAVQGVVENQPPYWHFWKMPGLYQSVSREQRLFGKAKSALVESLRPLYSQFPHIESDWHLKSVHREILSAFDIEESNKTAMMRLETIDSVYAHLAEQLSTMFFIFLDFVFLTWLLVDLCGWLALIILTALKQ